MTSLAAQTGSMEEKVPAAWTLVAAAAVRAAFGVVMGVDAWLKWKPEFGAHYTGYLQNALVGQPAWLAPWFHFWLRLVEAHTGFFVGATRGIESAIAFGLLFGFARKATYLVGGLFSLLIWSTAEGFGGAYTAGATNIGPALVYALVFAALAILAWRLGRSPYSLDYHIGRRFPAWRTAMELAPAEVRDRTPPALDWVHQAAAAAAVAVALVLALGTLHSATQVASPTPTSAAAAVSPLSLSTGQPVAHPYDPRLPPLLGTGDSVSVTLAATDANIEIVGGVRYQAWTFNGTVPAPILHVRQGQTVNVTLINKGIMAHSIDFHAAEVAPSVDYRSIQPGETLQFSFVARTPGVFIYHCGTPPVLLHIGNGMYGAIVVDPSVPLPHADASYVLVQGEWYTQQVSGKLLGGDFDKMQAGFPDEVVFNGAAFQYVDYPLAARVGQRVRLYVVDAGPNLFSAFHIIGGIFATVYPDGDARHALTGVSTYPIAPGEGVVFDAIPRQAGKYPIVDHSMRDMASGAEAILSVSP